MSGMTINYSGITNFHFITRHQLGVVHIQLYDCKSGLPLFCYVSIP